MAKIASTLAPFAYLAAFLVAPGPTILATQAAFVGGFLLLVGALSARELC